MGLSSFPETEISVSGIVPSIMDSIQIRLRTFHVVRSETIWKISNIQEDLPPGPTRAVYSCMKKNPQRIDQPEGNEDRRESPAQKMSEIIRPAVQAGNKAKA